MEHASSRFALQMSASRSSRSRTPRKRTRSVLGSAATTQRSLLFWKAGNSIAATKPLPKSVEKNSDTAKCNLLFGGKPQQQQQQPVETPVTHATSRLRSLRSSFADDDYMKFLLSVGAGDKSSKPAAAHRISFKILIPHASK
mmetsp:Transcript_17699/g.38383  ORF Transcript_17699/g.38383 Transcript_17699/m.38383 type:complete len:142 (-) Transcript_17699:590-1015(-)